MAGNQHTPTSAIAQCPPPLSTVREHPGVSVEDQSGVLAFMGAKDDLIAAGVACDGMFPSWPNRVLEGGERGERWGTERIVPGDRYYVCRCVQGQATLTLEERRFLEVYRTLGKEQQRRMIRRGRQLLQTAHREPQGCGGR